MCVCTRSALLSNANCKSVWLDNSHVIVPQVREMVFGTLFHTPFAKKSTSQTNQSLLQSSIVVPDTLTTYRCHKEPTEETNAGVLVFAFRNHCGINAPATNQSTYALIDCCVAPSVLLSLIILSSSRRIIEVLFELPAKVNVEPS